MESQVHALCKVCAATVEAADASKMRCEEYRKELRSHGLLQGGIARAMTAGARVEDDDNNWQPPKSDQGSDFGEDAGADERHQSWGDAATSGGTGQPVLYTSRADIVLRKYEPRTETEHKVVVNSATFKGCAVCHGPHLYSRCDYKDIPLCNEIFHENIHKLKPNL